MAVIPTIMALLVGTVVGLRFGGSAQLALSWRPRLWPIGVAGLALWLLASLTGVSGSAATALAIAAYGALGVFAAANIRVGGMVLVAAGLGLNLIPLLSNGVTPTSSAALVSAGLIDSSTVEEAGAALTKRAELNGAREVADGSHSFRPLGDVIALPTSQVVSPGDIVLLGGLALVVASVLRGRTRVSP